MAKAAGWETFPSEPTLNRRGVPIHGVITFTRWPTEEIPAEPGATEEAKKRRVVVRAYRPEGDCFNIGNQYLHAGDAAAAKILGMDTLQCLASQPGPSIAVGDWNNEPNQQPAAAAISTGRWHLMQSSPEGPWEATREQGRHIDYGVATAQVHPKWRRQMKQHGDHHMVCYGIEVQAPLPCHKRGKTRKLRTEGYAITEQQWEQAWKAKDKDFNEAIDKHDTEQAWNLVSAVAENLLAECEEERGRPRSRPAKPVNQKPMMSSKGKVLEGITVRSLLPDPVSYWLHTSFRP